MIREQVVRAFTHAALSPDPDLAVAALMIARVEYPKLDAGPYLDQLDALGREAQLRTPPRRRWNWPRRRTSIPTDTCA
jgi:hypothetical protein